MECSPSASIEGASLSISPQAVQLGNPITISCATSHNKTSIHRVEIHKQVDGVDVLLGDLSPGMQEVYINDGALPKVSHLERIDHGGSFGIEMLIAASNWSDSTRFECKVYLLGSRRQSDSKNLTVYGMLIHSLLRSLHRPHIFACLKEGFPEKSLLPQHETNHLNVLFLPPRLLILTSSF